MFYHFYSNLKTYVSLAANNIIVSFNYYIRYVKIVFCNYFFLLSNRKTENTF